MLFGAVCLMVRKRDLKIMYRKQFDEGEKAVTLALQEEDKENSKRYC
jgi:hypothetical protein